jgi:hypothetical protein
VSTRSIALALALSAAPLSAVAQTTPASQSAAELAARDPAGAVSATLGSTRALVRRAGAVPAPARGRSTQWLLARLQLSARPPRVAPDAPAKCYVLLAVASAVTDVAATIRADGAAVEQSIGISAASASGVRSTRFCVAASTMRIEASARSTSATGWAAALIEAPPEPPTPQRDAQLGQGARERLALALAANRGDGASGNGANAARAGARIELGGSELDFVGRQLREAYASVSGARAVTDASRAMMQTSQEREVRAALEEGRCYEAAAFAVPSVSDVDVSWIDPSGVRAAQDRGHQPNERVRLCPRFSGTFRATLRMFSGSGATVLQVVEVPSS